MTMKNHSSIGLFFLLALSALCAGPLHAQAPDSSVIGTWREPAGSVIEIRDCGGSDLCARIITLSSTAPGKLDVMNPLPPLRNQPLCGLEIGTGFHLTDAAHAKGGKLYDPKNGKTYNGTMTVVRGQLHLRGFVGIKAFGRSEVWTRTDRPADACEAPSLRADASHRF
jgi:uncharacterized protein (DUF2147 family)